MSDDDPGTDPEKEEEGVFDNGSESEAGSKTETGDGSSDETARASEEGDPSADAHERDDEWTPDWLAALRADDDRRHAALVAAALVGLAVAMVHWLGLFVAGALVGLVSRTLPRAVAAGLGVGVLVLVVHVGGSPVMGPGEFLALAPAAYLSVAAALLAPVWGSLVRGVL